MLRTLGEPPTMERLGKLQFPGVVYDPLKLPFTDSHNPFQVIFRIRSFDDHPRQRSTLSKDCGPQRHGIVKKEEKKEEGLPLRDETSLSTYNECFTGPWNQPRPDDCGGISPTLQLSPGEMALLYERRTMPPGWDHVLEPLVII